MKKITLLFTFFISVFLSYGQVPPNDTCASAIDLGAQTSPLTGTTVGALNDNIPTCGDAELSPDVYYSILVPNGSTLTIAQTVNSHDSVVSVFYGDCAASTAIRCFDDPDDSSTVWPNTTGSDQTVYYVVDGYNGASGTFTLAWSVVACSNAVATYTIIPDCANGAQFLVDVNVTSLGTATSLTISDSVGSPSQFLTAAGIVTFGPFPNASPVIFTIANDQDASCTVTSAPQNLAGCPPANDDCSGAVALTVNSDLLCTSVTSGSVAGATASATSALACFGTEDDDVWYSFVATATNHAVSLRNVLGSTTDLYHSLWSGSDCDNLTLVPNSCSDPNTSNPSGLTIGTTYYLRIYTWGAVPNQTSTFNVCIGTNPPPPPPPANDDCAGALALVVNSDATCTNVTASTVAGATASNQSVTDCGGTEDDDVWFSFVATGSSHLVSLLNVAGSTTDMYHSLWTGADCNNLTLVAGSCSDANNSNPVGLTFGTTYYLRVYTWGGVPNQTSTFNVCIGTPLPPPTNDDFVNAIALNCGDTVTADTAQATIDEDSAPDGFGCDLDSKNVWYKFTGTGEPQTVSLNLCTSSYDTSVMVYTGTSGNLTLIAGNDDEATCGVDFGSRSKVNFNSDGTTTYYITVEGWNSGNVGVFNMVTTCVAITPPAVANQDCGTALSVNLDDIAVSSDNSFGTVSPTQPGCDTFGTIQDVWFSFVATSATANCIVTNGTMTSSNFNVYSGSCPTPVAIAGSCNSNILTTATENLTGLTVGNTYFVQVWSSATEQGTFTLRMNDPTLGATTFDSSSFSSYPNPVIDVLNLSYSKNIDKVQVLNLVGQEVLTKSVNATDAKVDMSNLASGTYLVRVSSENQVKTLKVIKQ
jgi:Secretion system C-terminal sorting domain